MANNLIKLGSETLIDLTGDTVAPSNLLSGYTAHDKSGAAISGGVQSGTVALTLTPSNLTPSTSPNKYVPSASASLDYSSLTAVAGDVAQGKTFIGANGVGTGTQQAPSGYPDEYATGGSLAANTATGYHVKNGVTEIYIYAFYGRGSLVDVELPDSITSIGNYAFYMCTNLALESLPTDLISIGEKSFYNCPNLAIDSFPSGLKTIGESAFQYCTSLASRSLSSGLTSIGQNGFNGCTNLALTSLPSGLTGLSIGAFRSCPKLAISSIPSGITTIPQYGFYGCTGLTEIEFMGNIGNVNPYSFYGCTGLTKLKFTHNNKVPSMSNVNAFTNTTCTFVVPDSLYSSWTTATRWSTLASRIIKASEDV